MKSDVDSTQGGCPVSNPYHRQWFDSPVPYAQVPITRVPRVEKPEFESLVVRDQRVPILENLTRAQGIFSVINGEEDGYRNT